ncbi:SNARE-interacting protein KEULE [Selaginella moellendorffii]|uniref:SNARE-interacting protein KEULE n=1 Tax=Selaginella moellendorffii TaxID=88036 RepID=UPI000D1C5239|nr:SNARE-interacting protein KEULE [Selaginella moellendorffii]|eukprot:XP_024521880.1 SNARE-interacting protein KEULE [Selaginella moellendorffii]
MAEGSGPSARAPYKSFRHSTRERLLKEMLHSVKSGDSPNDWKVLVIDELTVRVMSSSCKMADITDEGISLVEDLNKKRQPMPTLEAVYFVRATNESITKIISDMSGKFPLYKRAYIFLSSSLTPDLLNIIKSEKTVIQRLAALKEMNLEYITIDSQGFVTDNAMALEQLFGENSDTSSDYEAMIDTIGTRLATVFVSLKEYPSVRFRAPNAQSSEDELPAARNLLSAKVAAVLSERLAKYKSALADFPKSETCDLLILDRSVDTVAPFIHEWTYDAMCHDLLGIEGNKYVYEITTGDKLERKEVLLEEHDPIWVELRHLHIAEANLKLTDKMNQFGSKNKAAQIRLGAKEGQDISTRDMQKLVQALPQFREQLDKLSLHIQVLTQIATVLNEKISEQSLSDIAALEQDFAFGGGSSKELVRLFNIKPDMSLENKLRLLLIYASAHPDKLDAIKRQQWMKAPSRKEKKEDIDTWDFSRFYPVIEVMASETASSANVEGKRIFVFIIGGTTRVELKAMHKLTLKLRREVILGSTSLDEPHQYLEVAY